MRLPTVIKLLLFLCISLQICTATDFEYEYDENAEFNVTETDGIRLVGAERESSKLLWVVGYSPHGPLTVNVSCTGSLISSNWVLIAAHCLPDLLEYVIHPQYCVKKYWYSRRNECDRLWDGSYKVDVQDKEGYVYLGVSDFNNKNDVRKGHSIKVDYIVGHSESYRGRGNGRPYSGYDIALLHLAQPAPAKFQPVCLPGLYYKDTGYGYKGCKQAHLAGYGYYSRDKCITDDYGPSKYHYCEHAGQCNFSEPPPRKDECEEFFNSPGTPDDVPEGDTDLILLTKRNEKVYCYPHKSRDIGSKGWCEVKNDASTIGELNDGVNSWGFCDAHCHLDSNEKETGVLRHRQDVDILDEELCNYYLNVTLNHYRNDLAIPKIVCVGITKSLKYTVWKKIAGKYVELNPRKIKFRHRLENDEILDERNVYVHSAGTCHGDSGGPVYTYDEWKRKNVVLGVVSGGRGKLGDCGGLNNPTHYARVREFTRWIQNILSTTWDKVCVLNN